MGFVGTPQLGGLLDQVADAAAGIVPGGNRLQNAVQGIRCALANTGAILDDLRRLPMGGKAKAELEQVEAEIQEAESRLSIPSVENIERAAVLACDVSTKIRRLQKIIFRTSFLVGAGVFLIGGWFLYKKLKCFGLQKAVGFGIGEYKRRKGLK